MGVVARRGRTLDGRSLALALCAGCSNPKDPISQAEKKEAVRPSLEEVKAIAEEGFIYGLPIVMNYGVMYEFVVDRNSGQWKAPFNQIANEARVFTSKDTGVVTPEQRHAVLDALARPARGADGALGPGGSRAALLLGDALRREHLQLRLHRHPRDGDRAGRLPGRRARTGRARRRPG